MSRLPRFKPDQIIKGTDLNIVISALDAGGILDLTSQTNAGITGQGLVPTVPNTNSGSTTPAPGSVGAPNTPIGLVATTGIDYYSQTHDGFCVLSWTPNPVSDFVARYDVYFHKGSDPFLHNLTVGGDVTTIRINSLVPGQTYIFAIQAHDAANRASNFSMELPVYIPLDIDPPAVPTGLTASVLNNTVYLNWTEVGAEGVSNDLKQYQLSASVDNASNKIVDPGFEDANLAATQTHWTLVTPAEYALDTSIFHGGATSLRCTTTRVSVGWNPAQTILNNSSSLNPVFVTPNQSYTTTGWFKQTGGTKTTHVKILYYQGDAVTLSGIRTTDFVMGGMDGLLDWTQFNATFTPPSDARFAQVNLMSGYWDGITDANAQIWWDDVSFVANPNLITLGPGNSYTYQPDITKFPTGISPVFYFKIATVDWTGNTSAYSSVVSATINQGTLINGELEITNGNSLGADTVAQIEFGWDGSAPLLQYQHWLATQHNGGSGNGNTIQFYTSDGTANGVFPTNGILGLTVTNGSINVPTSIAVGGSGMLITTTAVVVPSSVTVGPAAGNISTGITSSTSDSFFGQGAQGGTGTYADIGSLGDGGNIWLDARGSPTDIGINIRTKGAGNVTILSSGSGGKLTVPLSVHVKGGNESSNTTEGIFSAQEIRFAQVSGDEVNAGVIDYVGFDANALSIVGRGTTGGSRLVRIWDHLGVNNAASTSYDIITSADISIGGRAVFATAVSKIIPGATSISLRNNADSADNLLIANAGSIQTRSAISVPGTAGGTIASSQYGSLPVLIDVKSGNSATYDFTSIPTTYSALELSFYLRSTSATNGQESVAMTFNADTGSNYYWERNVQVGTTTTAPQENLTAANFGFAWVVGGGSTAGLHGAGKCIIPRYWGTTTPRIVSSHFTCPTALTTGTIRVELTGGVWNNSSAAITRITLTPPANFDSTSYCELWGLP